MGRFRGLWRRKYRFLYFISPVVFLLDQWSKWKILEQFKLGESVPVIKEYFHLTYVRNTGAAFGIFADAPAYFRVPFFLTVPVIALGIIAYIFKKLPDESIKVSLALSLVVGGAAGNLLDRIRLGYVVDFFDFFWKYGGPHFPAFNIADAAICVGVAILIVDLIFEEKEKAHVSSPT